MSVKGETNSTLQHLYDIGKEETNSTLQHLYDIGKEEANQRVHGPSSVLAQITSEDEA
jgi:hypothetical protein